MEIAQSIEREIVDAVREWEGVTVEDRAGGRVEFLYEGQRFGHIDDDGSLDLPLSIRLRAALVEAGHTEPHPEYAKTGWTTFQIDSNADIEAAIRLCRLSYVYRRLDLSQEDGRGELADGISLKSELEAFGTDGGVREAFDAMRRV